MEELRRVTTARIVAAFRRRPLRTLLLLAAVVYVVGLMAVLVIGLFDQTPTVIIRE